MKKYLGIIVVFAVIGLCGCPVNVTVPPVPIDPVVDDPIIDPIVDPAIPAGMGEVVVEGSLLDAEKTIADWNGIVNLFRPRISWMEFTFYPSQPSGDPVLAESLKGGGPEGTQHFYVDVIDGVYRDEFLLNVGAYDVWVSAYDNRGEQRFYASSFVEVVNGQTATLPVMFRLVEYANHRFIVNGLPGQYGENSEYGEVAVTDGAGNSYYAQYYRYYPDMLGKADASVIVFYASLPIDFDGEADGGALIVRDINGDNYATKLDFSVFDIDNVGDYGVMEVQYEYPDWLGEVEVDIDFEHYPVPVG